ncbi:MAG: hypothetical protein A2X45_13340 [Lentisphaerae bacterium GWF2_50_93]|nr:MAG: hypothetical protein A2X45_13340 [Lentisphaerae bacterium GWF2_50_93]
MRFLSAIGFFLTLCISVLAEEPQKIHSYDPDVKAYPIQRQIEYVYLLENKGNTVQKDVRLMIYAPVSRTPFQSCKSIETTRPSIIHKDELGNQVLEFSIPQMAPFETVIIKTTVDLQLSSTAQPAGNGDVTLFTGKAPFIEIDDPEIVKLSKSLTAGNPGGSSENIYRWICENIKKSGYTAQDLGASEALKCKAGDCSEKAYLFCALARVALIPAQYHSGYYVTKNSVLKPFQFHNWAAWHDGKSWQIADPQLKKFQKEPENFISFTIDGGSSGKLMAGMHRYHINSTVIDVSMK